MSGPSLEEVLATGQGIERSFNHDSNKHRHPTASVNTIKNVWVCYSCQDRGAVDSSRVPSVDELDAMLEPEKAARRYPTSWLATFGIGGYWETRFPRWLCWHLNMGEDPWTGEGTYPVHTDAGTLAGVCKRALTDGPWPKYKYPRNWSASRALFGSNGVYLRHDVLMLVEGAADAAAGLEVGCPTFGVYGSGVHAPQVELIARMAPKTILLGFDKDDAGERAAQTAHDQLGHLADLVRIDWGTHKDPAEVPVEERLKLLSWQIPFDNYDVIARWQANVAALKGIYAEEETHG